MFYIDFTSPDGKTYLIDLSEHKLIHSCPVCGIEQQIMLMNQIPISGAAIAEKGVKNRKRSRKEKRRNAIKSIWKKM